MSRRDEDGSALGAYLREIAKLPRLTADEERALGMRIQDDRDEAAMARLVEANLRFVVSYAKRYRGHGVSFLDLIHEGNLGLMEAARRFDPAHNVKFITYAVWWASRIAALPPEVVQLNKRLVHRQMEHMGMRAGLRAGTELCAIGTHTKAMAEFMAVAREKGLTNALQERDEPFGDYRTSAS